MRNIRLSCAVVLALSVFEVAAGEAPIARPQVLLKEDVQGMPRGDLQEVKVLTASIQPGGATVFHTHRFPVTVYVMEGTFSLEMEGRAPVVVEAGEAMVEPPNVRMTGFNRSATETMRVVIFYVGDPGTPFLDPIAAGN